TRASQSPYALSASETSHSDSATPASPTPVPGVARARSTGPATTAAHAAAPGLRQAARVSVEKSATEPGLFLVRVLDDGSAPPSGRVEALLVAVDPSSGLF
ncbi:MAG TPA: hypothetical protein VGK73_15825, partial [Polyangiaceae bacterium]